MLKELTQMQTLFSISEGRKIELPENITSIYGDFHLPGKQGESYVMANFVTTLDGVISLNIPGLADGGAISGYNPNDAMVMGLLRAISDVVIIGKGTLFASPNHLWIPEEIYPPFAEEFNLLRKSAGKAPYPYTVLVSSEGNIEPFYRLFQTENVPVIIITTKKGQETLRENNFPERIKIISAKESGNLTSEEILRVITKIPRTEVILVEGGPHLLEAFIAEKTLNELFLTISPQIAGREESIHRPAMIENKMFNPGNQLWERLTDVRQAGDFLFLRYSFSTHQSS